MTKQVLEGELVDKSVNKSYQKNTSASEIIKFPLLKLTICLIPIVGFMYSIIWYKIERSKNSPIFLAAIAGLVLSIFSSFTFLVLMFILKIIF
ncbi:MAG: hypothetical protein U0451_00995 [Candidatus Saccharimonadales bacterium]